jgi:osmoprotectant transport system permease protein
LTFPQYLASRWPTILGEAIAHINIVVLSVLIASCLGIAVGILTFRRPLASQTAIGVAGAFLTIPSIAFLGLLIPFLGLGYLPTLVALVLYALLPIIRNTVAGLRGVNPALVEAATGMGMSRTSRMLRVELPLAWPVILAGVRVSTQLIVGIAAIAAYVAGPGLGNDIFDGLSRMGSANALNLALGGTLGVIVLALLFDAALLVVGRLTTSRGIRA